MTQPSRCDAVREHQSAGPVGLGQWHQSYILNNNTIAMSMSPAPIGMTILGSQGTF